MSWFSPETGAVKSYSAAQPDGCAKSLYQPDMMHVRYRSIQAM
jgi:hypothetical protein